MSLNIQLPENTIMKPHITVFGVGGAGGNATANMIKENLEGVNFVVANTDAQALENSVANKRIQLGQNVTQGLGAGASPDIGRQAAEEAADEIVEHIQGSNMVFITAGMGGGTGTGAAPVLARIARENNILTIGVVTKPFHFEGPRRMKLAEQGLEELQKHIDTLIVIPNQNLFRIANEKTTFADAFKMADNVLHRGVRGVTDLMVMPGLINLDFADVKAVMGEMGKAMMGTGEAEGERRAQEAAEAAISNPLLDNVSMKGARGVLINITGGPDMTLFEVDEAANRVREEVDSGANIIFGSTFNEDLEGKIRVSVVATGIDAATIKNTETGSPITSNSNIGDQSDAGASEEGGDNDNEQGSVESDENDNILAQQDANEKVVTQEQDGNGRAENVETTSETSDSNSQDTGANVLAADNEEDEFAPSNADKQYFDAIRKLNAEYKARSSASESSTDKTHSVGGGTHSNTFVPSAAPILPSNYVASDINSYATDGASRHTGVAANDVNEKSGLFSRMAKVARSFKGSDEDYEDDVDEGSSEGSDAHTPTQNSTNRSDDSVDIPAFLRRKV